MISRVSVRNFKCLRDVQIDLERFTVFVGPNASGKSSILQAIDLLCRSFRGQEGGIDAEIRQALSSGSTESVELIAESDGNCFRYRTVPPALANTPLFPLQFGAHQGQPWTGVGRGFAAINSDDWRHWPPDQHNRPSLPVSVLLRLESSKLINSELLNPADASVMAPDGSGLHFALASMALHDPDSWQQLQNDLRRIIPTIVRLRHQPLAMGQQMGMRQPVALLFDTIGAHAVPASQVSEGTLLVLGLLAVLHSPGRPNLVLLDDLDRGLHPRAQKDLIALLRELLKTNPTLQLMATCHSPYLLDWMETKEVRMTYVAEDGATVCAPLAKHPKFQKWKDEMTPGEMWGLFGENWLVERGTNP